MLVIIHYGKSFGGGQVRSEEIVVFLQDSVVQAIRTVNKNNVLHNVETIW